MIKHCCKIIPRFEYLGEMQLEALKLPHIDRLYFENGDWTR